MPDPIHPPWYMSGRKPRPGLSLVPDVAGEAITTSAGLNLTSPTLSVVEGRGSTHSVATACKIAAVLGGLTSSAQAKARR
jgi:hypothetical protein